MDGGAADERAAAARGFRRTLVCLAAVMLLSAGLQSTGGSGGTGGTVGADSRDAAWLLWPQGWSLFAGGEDGAELVAYAPTPSGWRSLLRTPFATSGDLWGLDRSWRTQGHEIELLAAEVPAADWRACGAPALAACHWASPPPVWPTVTPAGRPTLCGRIAVAAETPPPPTAARDARFWRIDRVAVFQIRCP